MSINIPKNIKGKARLVIVPPVSFIIRTIPSTVTPTPITASIFPVLINLLISTHLPYNRYHLGYE